MKIKTICHKCGRRARLIKKLCPHCQLTTRAFKKEQDYQEARRLNKTVMFARAVMGK